MRKANRPPRGSIQMRARAKPSIFLGRTVIKLQIKPEGLKMKYYKFGHSKWHQQLYNKWLFCDGGLIFFTKEGIPLVLLNNS